MNKKKKIKHSKYCIYLACKGECKKTNKYYDAQKLGEAGETGGGDSI